MRSTRLRRRLFPLFAAAALLATVQNRTSAENWPGWRGPNRNAVSGEKNLPLRWSATEGVQWKAPLPGSGVSSPIVWDDQVIATSSDGKDSATLHVISLDRHSGRERWHLRLWGTAPTLSQGTKSNMATPAPVTDGRHVYAFFGTGDVFCIDMAGGLVWQRSLASEFGPFENRFAHSSSPLLYRDMVVLQCDHYGDSYLIAVDQKTGTTRWKTDRPGRWLSWSSPQLVEVKDDVHNGQADSSAQSRHELIVCGSLRVDAYDPSSGSHLWTVGGMQRECIPTPVVAHGRVYAVSGPGGQSMAIRPGGHGDVTKTHVLWSSPRGVPYVPSAIVVGDYYYLIDDDGIGTCLSTRDGSRVWQKRFSGKYTASPVAGDGKIYFINEAGDTTVIASHTAGYRELARNALGEPVYASPAISAGQLFIRGATHLYCVGQQ